MAKKFLDIEHSRIDTLSDGIYAIALTLLGFDLIGSVKKASEAKSLALGLAEQWPTYFSFFLGFLFCLRPGINITRGHSLPAARTHWWFGSTDSA